MPLEGAYAFSDVGSGTVLDLSGNGRHITLSGAAQVDSGGALDGGALAKTAGGTISLPAQLRTAMETDDRTIMCDVLGGRGIWIIRFLAAPLGDIGVFGILALDSANAIGRARTQTNVGPSATPSIGPIGAPRHNLALRYVRATGVLTPFYDGAPQTPVSFAPGTALYVGADDLGIAEWSSSGPSLDNLRLFSHAVPDGEIAVLAVTPVTAPALELPLNPASEDATAEVFGRQKARSTGVGAETDQALPFGRHKQLALGTAFEDAAALGFGRARALELGTAAEGDVAGGVAATKRRQLLPASEVDAAGQLVAPMADVGWPPQVGAGEDVSVVAVGVGEPVDLVRVGPGE